MILTTTSTVENKNIKEYRGIVFGEVVTGIDFVRDFGASITNFFGGRSEEYEEELVNARADAINEMIKKAEKIGANALVGVTVNTESMPMADNRGSMLVITVSGTAVVID